MEINRRDSVCSTSSFLPQWPQKEKKEWLCRLEHYSSHNVIHLCLCSAKASLVYLALWHSPIVLSRHTHTHTETEGSGHRCLNYEWYTVYLLSSIDTVDVTKHCFLLHLHTHTPSSERNRFNFQVGMMIYEMWKLDSSMWPWTFGRGFIYSRSLFFTWWAPSHPTLSGT